MEKSVPVMNPIALPLWCKAKKVPRSWLRECQRSFSEMRVWEMFHKWILKASQRQTQENRRKPPGCWSGRTIKTSLLWPRGSERNKMLPGSARFFHMCKKVVWFGQFYPCYFKTAKLITIVSELHYLLLTEQKIYVGASVNRNWTPQAYEIAFWVTVI